MVDFRDRNLNADRTLEVATGILENQLVATQTMTRMADDKFYGTNGKTISVAIRSPLPTRRYPLYNDRAEPLKMDFPEETQVTLTVNKDRIYSAVPIRDEIKDFDLNGDFGWIVKTQMDSLTNAFEAEAKKLIFDAKYEYVKHVDLSAKAIKDAAEIGQDATYNAFDQAKADLILMGAPVSSFNGVYALVGAEWAAHLRRNQRLNLAKTNNTQQAFADNTLGTYAGITFVEVTDPEFDPKEAYIYTGDAFLQWSSAPSIPSGAKAGSITSNGSLALRWIMDYSSEYATDRSFFSAYTAFGTTEDRVFVRDTAGNYRVSEDQFFMRGVKLVLGGSSSDDILPGNGKGAGLGANADSYLAKRFSRQAVAGPEDHGIYTDLTYQNIVDGKVAAGKGGPLEVPAKEAPKAKAEPKAKQDEGHA